MAQCYSTSSSFVQQNCLVSCVMLFCPRHCPRLSLLWDGYIPELHCQFAIHTLNNITAFCICTMINPFSPAKAPNLAELCNPITRQAIELDSYPNHPRIQQNLVIKIEKHVFRFWWGDLWKWRHKEGMFWKFWPLLAGPGPQLFDPLFWLKVLLKTRRKSASIEPWDWLASISLAKIMGQKPSFWPNSKLFRKGISGQTLANHKSAADWAGELFKRRND